MAEPDHVRAPVGLKEIVDPARTAVLTMELQRGVVGDLAAFPELRDAVDSTGLLAQVGRICASARDVGVRIVHCTAEFRPDRLGSVANCRMLAAAEKLNAGNLDQGRPGTELVPELGAQAGDITVARSHGLTPFTSTDLDQILRNMGVSTVIAVGSSINVGILGMVLSAVDLGYQVVVPSDAVVGVPQEYGESVMSNTIALLASIVSTNDLVNTWTG